MKCQCKKRYSYEKEVEYLEKTWRQVGKKKNAAELDMGKTIVKGCSSGA